MSKLPLSTSPSQRSLLGGGLLLSTLLLSPGASEAQPPGPSVDATRATVTGTAKREPSTGLVFVWMPGGSFVFGCEDAACQAPELPAAEQVTLPGFWMTRARVTVAEYGACVQAGSCEPRPSHRWCTSDQPSSPVNCVSWPQAQAFCSWIDAQLPSERQWEFAADSGYDMNWEYGVDFNGHSHGASEWVSSSAPVTEGYRSVRGGVADLEPIWPSDRAQAVPGLQTGELGFRCVQSAP